MVKDQTTRDNLEIIFKDHFILFYSFSFLFLSCFYFSFISVILMSLFCLTFSCDRIFLCLILAENLGFALLLHGQNQHGFRLSLMERFPFLIMKSD